MASTMDIPPPAFPPPPLRQQQENADPNKATTTPAAAVESKKRRHATRRMTMAAIAAPPVPMDMSTPSAPAKTRHRHHGSSSAALDDTPLPLSPAERAAGLTVLRVLRSARIHAKWHTLVAEYPRAPAAAKARKRNCVMREILSTERSYVASLTTLIQTFLRPLREAAAAHGKASAAVLGADSIAEIFGNVEGIRELNASLLRDLDERAREWPSCPCIGDIILRNADFFRVYIGYVNRYSAAHDTLDRLRRTSKPFAEFLAAAAQQIPDALDITGYLIMPIQRIPRYKLLLEDLLRSTEPENADYDAVAKSLAKIREIAATINERKRDTDANAKVAEAQALLVDAPQNFALLAPHRRFVRSGPLRFEVSPTAHSKLPQAKNPCALLFNDLLLFVDKLPEGGKMRFRDVWQLQSLTVSMAPPSWLAATAPAASELVPTTFALSVFGAAVGAAVLAATSISAEEKAAWVEDISRCKNAIEEKRARMSLTISERSASAALWESSDSGSATSGVGTRKRSSTVSALRQQLQAEFSPEQQPFSPSTPTRMRAPSHPAMTMPQFLQQQQQQPAPQVQVAPPPPLLPQLPAYIPPPPLPAAESVKQQAGAVSELALAPAMLQAGLLVELEKEAAEVARAQAAVCAAADAVSWISSLNSSLADLHGQSAAIAATVEAAKRQRADCRDRLAKAKALRRDAEERYNAVKARLTTTVETLLASRASAARQLAEADELWRSAQEARREQQEVEATCSALERETRELAVLCARETRECEVLKTVGQRLEQDAEVQRAELAEALAATEDARQQAASAQASLKQAQARRDEAAMTRLAQQRRLEQLRCEHASIREALAAEMANKAAAHRALLEASQAEEHELVAAAEEEATTQELAQRGEQAQATLAELAARLRDERRQRKELEARAATLRASLEERAAERQRAEIARHEVLASNVKLDIEARELAARYGAEQLRCSAATEDIDRTMREVGPESVPSDQLNAVRALRGACAEKLRQAEAVAESMAQFARQIEESRAELKSRMRLPAQQPVGTPSSSFTAGESGSSTGSAPHQATPAASTRRHKHHHRPKLACPSSSSATPSCVE